jgi:hypothetical protein
MKCVPTLLFLLSLSVLSQPAFASAAAFLEDMRSAPPVTLVADQCWLRGGDPHDSCNRPWWACLDQVKRRFGSPAPHGAEQTNGSQPSYDESR